MILELLQFPFIQRAIIAGLILALLYAILGVYVVLRNMAFWGDGIAHASLAGISLALYAGYSPTIWAILVAIVFAVFIFYLERKTNLSNDTIIGVLFTAFMALGVVILSLTPGYQPELISFLFGNILTISFFDLIVMLVVSLLIFIFVVLQGRQLSLLTFDKESAYLAGIKVDLLDLIFYIALAVAVVLGVKILGIILVSALLIIPASIAKLIAGSYKTLRMLSVVISELVVVTGLLLSFWLDLPSGPMIILVGAGLFVIINLLKIKIIFK